MTDFLVDLIVCAVVVLSCIALAYALVWVTDRSIRKELEQAERHRAAAPMWRVVTLVDGGFRAERRHWMGGPFCPVFWWESFGTYAAAEEARARIAHVRRIEATGPEYVDDMSIERTPPQAHTNVRLLTWAGGAR